MIHGIMRKNEAKGIKGVPLVNSHWLRNEKSLTGEKESCFSSFDPFVSQIFYEKGVIYTKKEPKL